ncbi:hypothetical protein C5S31_11420 [ANME-1 cluster archaeon GoMg2]|nr:hypothetical protein [ANME-1 cluster archaeon GoMg2]
MKNIKGLRDKVKEIKRINGIKEALLKQFVPEFPADKVHITKFPEDLWSPGVGGGALIEFDMTLEEGDVLD